MRWIASMLVLALAGCVTPAVSSLATVPPDTATTCSAHCASIGMELGAVVLMHNAAGCVCQPRPVPGGADAQGGAAAGGSVVAAAAAARAAAEQQRRQQASR